MGGREGRPSAPEPLTGRAVDVAVPLPVQKAFTYALADGQPTPPRGARVLVPFGPRRVVGVVTGTAEPPADTELKAVLQVMDTESVATPGLLDLAEWMAGHYLAAPGECYRLVMPPASVRASRSIVRLAAPPDGAALRDDPIVSALAGGPLALSVLAKRVGSDPAARVARLRRDGVVDVEQEVETGGFKTRQVARLEQPDVVPRGVAQTEIVERLKAAGGRKKVADLVADRPSLRSALKRLAVTGVVHIDDEREVRTPEMLPAAASTAPKPTADQEDALLPILSAVRERRAETILLHGVTGSGKTEVYFRAAEAALAEGRGALVLVPEIALTPLLVRAALARFGPIVAVVHSELSAGERHDQWWRIREGEARVVVGARSAVFAPIPDLGLIVVDEEHESSYKQEESPRYHGRDVAVMRGRLEKVPVVLGSATPSVESQTNVVKGKYRRAGLPTRIGRWGLPGVEVVDRRALLKAGGDPILSPALLEALNERLQRGEQSLILLNRRGYATSLLCRECGEQAACPNCSVSLTLHQGGRRALCHYCGFSARPPARCATCQGEYLRLMGFGTEKVVEALRGRVPKARVDRLDRDQAQKRGQIARVLARFEAGELDVLVGTQMIAKGHDFPRVTLVGVVDADVGLGLPDFRAAERTFQLLTQVAGRAGRAELRGEVILQSHLPDHYALRLACAQDYDAFYEREMEFRRTMGYPPTTALVNVIVRSRDPEDALCDADRLAAKLRERAGRAYRVLGPAAAPLARLRQEHRVQVLLKGQRKAMREAVRAVLVERHGDVRWPGVMVDVDPLSVL